MTGSGVVQHFLIAFAILMWPTPRPRLQPAVFASLQALVRMGTTAVGVLAIVLIVEQLSPQVRCSVCPSMGRVAASARDRLAVLLWPSR